MAGARIEVLGLRELQRALKQFAPEVQKVFRARLRAIARAVASDAKGRASWSHRIPSAITYGATNKGLYVRVKATQGAPHATLYEGRDHWRHPLFGDRDHWYAQRGRPFLRPAAEAAQGQVLAEAEKAVEAAKHEVEL